MSMTTSGNIAGTMRPFAVGGKTPWPYGKGLVPISSIGKKVRGGTDKMLFVYYSGLMKLESLDEWTNKDMGDGTWKVTPPGKVGVWRHAANRNMFFPDDGSKPVGAPPANLDKKAEDMLGKIKAMKGKAKGGTLKALNDMEKALESGDAEAFKKASGKLDKTVKKMKKKRS